MTNSKSYRENNFSALHQKRNRIVAAVRQMLVPTGSDLNTEPFVFMSGNTFDMDMLKLTSDLAEGLESDVIYVEFAVGQAVLRPGSIVVIVARGGITHLVRNCDLWVSKTGGACALVPALSVGHLVCEKDELVHLPGKPARRPAPGIARARIAVCKLAASLPDEEAKRFVAPLAHMAA